MNSFLLLDKASGFSSFDVIRKLRKITKIRKIGHAGTLDPFATGLLICATGQYTRLLKYAEAQYKSYEATVLFGKSSTTGDPDGEIVAKQIPQIQPQYLNQLRQNVLALKELQVPLYSAVHIEGERAYKLARAGKNPQMPNRAVQIHDFEILNYVPNASLSYRVKVSKGTYIRALSEYIAAQLGTIGLTSCLRRVAIGEIEITRAKSLAELEPDWEQGICPVSDILSNLSALQVSPLQVEDFRHGRRFSLGDDYSDGTELALYDSEHQLIGIGSAVKGYIRPVLVINGDAAR